MRTSGCKEPTVHDLIQAFIYSANYRSWLTSGSTSECLEATSLKMKGIVKCGVPKLLAEFVKSNIGI